jgi:hypothetical protein
MQTDTPPLSLITYKPKNYTCLQTLKNSNSKNNLKHTLKINFFFSKMVFSKVGIG